jgi:hypothetical protein
MHSNKPRELLIASCLFFTPVTAWGQSSSQLLTNLKTRMDAITAAAKNMPGAERRTLSGDWRNLIHIADNWSSVGAALGQAAVRTQARDSAAGSTGRDDDRDMIPVSNPDTDFLVSRMTGFTQSETSTAWCGNNVVVGFDDSGSMIETYNGFLQGANGLSMIGVAFSSDQGRTFHDTGSLNPGPDPSGQLVGYPTVACADANTFYYSSIFTSGFLNPLTSISVSKSTDGGATFGNPVLAVSKSGPDFIILDKDSITVDPTNPNRIFVTYTYYDFSGGGRCPVFGSPNAIELVSSADGGGTWTSPVVIQEVCDTGLVYVEDSQVEVGPGGEVYVAWELGSGGTTAEALIRKSTNHGVTFGPSVTIVPSIATGDSEFFLFQGGFLTGRDISLAVDRSGKATNGNLYLTWQSAGPQVPSFTQSPDTYRFTDVFTRRSRDGGATWSSPVQITDNTERASTVLTDAFQPGIAVDNTGKIGVCFYDRRRDPLNFMIDRYCATSTDAGATWRNRRESSPSWAPWHATDVVLDPSYMSEYDGMASDFTNSASGFVGAYQFMNTGGRSSNSNTGDGGSGDSIPIPNPDVFAVRLK